LLDGYIGIDAFVATLSRTCPGKEINTGSTLASCMTTIVRDEAVRSGSPRVSGTRVTVLDIKRRVIDDDEDPHVVAGEYEISMADLFHALAHYYDERDEFEAREREAAAARRDGESRTRDLLERVGRGETDPSERAD